MKSCERIFTFHYFPHPVKVIWIFPVLEYLRVNILEMHAKQNANFFSWCIYDQNITYHLSVLAFVKFQFYFSPLNAKSYLTSSLDKKMFILMCKQALYKCVRYSYKRSLLELLTYPQFWQKRSFENWNIFASCHFVTHLTVLEQLSTSDWKDHFSLPNYCFKLS